MNHFYCWQRALLNCVKSAFWDAKHNDKLHFSFLLHRDGCVVPGKRRAHLSVIVTGSDFLERNIFLLCSTGSLAAHTAVPRMHSAAAYWAACWWCVKGLQAQLCLMACCQVLMRSPLHLGAATRHLLKHGAWVQLQVLFLVLLACSQVVMGPHSGLFKLYNSIWKVHVLLVVIFRSFLFFPFAFLWALSYQLFDPWNKQSLLEVNKLFHVGNKLSVLIFTLSQFLTEV